MARKPRIEYPGALFHVIVRGNNRQEIFHDDEDRRTCLHRLGLYLAEGGVTVYCFCLMSNHVHLLVEMGERPLSQVLQRVLTWYARYHSVKYGRVGHLFQGRYKAILCDKDAYLLELVRYIHLNPVRAGLVTNPREYAWSSHRAYLGEETYKWLNTDLVLAQLAQGIAQARRLYDEFVMRRLGEGHRPDLYDLTDQRILGEEDFVAGVMETSKATVSKPKRFSLDLPSLQAIVEQEFDLAPQTMLTTKRPGVPARRLFCYLAREHGGFKSKDVAAYLGKDMATVTQGVRFITQALKDSDHLRKTVEGVLRQVEKGRVTFQNLLTTLREFFAKEEAVSLAYLFGSAAKDKRGPISDIDIAVLYRGGVAWDRQAELAFRIRTHLGDEKIDLVPLYRAPVELAYTCIADGILLHAETKATRVEFETKVLGLYGDFLPILEKQRREVLESDHEAGTRRYYKAFREVESMFAEAGTSPREEQRRVRSAAVPKGRRGAKPRGGHPVSHRHG